jgi:hypothetical protein
MTVEASELLLIIGRYPNRVIVQADSYFGLVWSGHSFDDAAGQRFVNLAPDDFLDLGPGWPCGNHDAVFVENQPPENSLSDRKGLARSVAAFNRGACVLCDRAKDVPVQLRS